MVKRPRKHGAAVLSLAVGLLLAASGLSAQSSTYVSPWDPAYHDVDALLAAGLVSDAMVGQRPYSRAAFARMAQEARSRLEAGDGPLQPARVHEALRRLERRFAGPSPSLGLTDLSVDGTWASSPSRTVPTSYEDRSYIDAELNPLLQADDGRVLADGWTQGIEAGVELRPGGAVTAMVRPRVWWSDPRGGDVGADATLQEAYLRAVLGNLSVDVGRSFVFQGQGRRAGVILSRNPRALDGVRLANERAFRLPWIFGLLGPMGASALLADLGGDRDTPHAKLIVFKVDARPHPNLELGVSLLNLQGGQGAPEASFWTRLRDVFLWGVPGFDLEEISDKVAGFDARLTLPDAGMEAYVEWSVTDLNLYRWGEMMGDEGAWVGGLRFPRLGEEGRAALWVEGHRSGVRPHTHHQFTSGLTLDGRLLGDPLGPMGTGLSAGVDWAGAAHAFTLSGTWERYRGDHYENNGEDGGDFRWVMTSDGPDEVRVRAEAEWSWQGEALGLRPSARVGVERVTRFDYGTGSRTNAVAQFRMSYLFR